MDKVQSLELRVDGQLKEIEHLQESVALVRRRLSEIETAETVIFPGEAVPEADTLEEQVAVRVIDVAIASFDVHEEDVVVFWLPATLTHQQVREMDRSFDKFINNRFHYLVLVKGEIDIQVLKGSEIYGSNQEKSGIIR